VLCLIMEKITHSKFIIQEKTNDIYVFFIMFALLIERKKLVFHPVFKTGNRRIKPAVAGSIPALSANLCNV
jgi:hypothetical protein